MNKLLIGLVIILIVILGGFLVFSSSDEIDSRYNEEIIPGDSSNVKKENPSPSNNAKIFVITGENFKFMMDGVENPDILVNQGDLVRIEFSSVGGFHDWVVDEFDAATSKVNEGGTTSVEFIADEAGTFEYYCSIGQHREMGMKGNLIVV